MPLFKRLFNFYVFSYIHVSLATYCLVKITLKHFSIEENRIALFVLLATIISYNFIRFYNISTIETKASDWIIIHKKSLIVLNLISVIGVIEILFTLRLEAIILLIPFVLATIFYIVPIYPTNINLRSLATLKLFLIAFTWAGVTVLFPLIQYDIFFSTEVWLIFVQRLLIIVAITIPFDLRDLIFDKIELKTLPQLFGVQKSKIVGIVAVLLFFILDIYQNKIQIDFKILIISIITILALYFSSSKQSKYYSSFWIEGIPILWYLILLF